MKNRTQLKYMTFAGLFIANIALGSANGDHKKIPSENALKKQAQKSLTSDPKELNSKIVQFLGIDTDTFAQQYTERFLGKNLQPTKETCKIFLHNTSNAYDTTILTHKTSGGAGKLSSLKAGKKLHIGNTQNIRPVFGLKTSSVIRKVASVLPDNTKQYADQFSQFTEGTFGYDSFKAFNLNDVILGNINANNDIHVNLNNAVTHWLLSCNSSQLITLSKKFAPLALLLHNKSTTYEIDIDYWLDKSSDPYNARVAPGSELKLVKQLKDIQPEIIIKKVAKGNSLTMATAQLFGSLLTSSSSSSSNEETSESGRYNIANLLAKKSIPDSAKEIRLEVDCDYMIPITVKTTLPESNGNRPYA